MTEAEKPGKEAIHEQVSSVHQCSISKDFRISLHVYKSVYMCTLFVCVFVCVCACVCVHVRLQGFIRNFLLGGNYVKDQ